MKTLLAACVLLPLGLALAGAAPTHTDGPEWHTDLDEAAALARETERPLLIVFR